MMSLPVWSHVPSGGWGVGTRGGGIVPRGGCLVPAGRGGMAGPPDPRGQTNTYKNITFPQLRLRVVIMYWKYTVHCQMDCPHTSSLLDFSQYHIDPDSLLCRDLSVSAWSSRRPFGPLSSIPSTNWGYDRILLLTLRRSPHTPPRQPSSKGKCFRFHEFQNRVSTFFFSRNSLTFLEFLIFNI